MILKSMCDFVEEQFQRWDKVEISSEEFVNLVEYHRMFLKRIIKLGDFVPTNKDGNVLKKPKPENYFDVNKPGDQFNDEDKDNLNEYYSALMIYEQAEQNVLFEGFEYVEQLENKKDKNVPYHKFLYNGQFFYIEFEGTIDRIVEREFELTQTAQKLIGL